MTQTPADPPQLPDITFGLADIRLVFSASLLMKHFLGEGDTPHRQDVLGATDPSHTGVQGWELSPEHLCLIAEDLGNFYAFLGSGLAQLRNQHGHAHDTAQVMTHVKALLRRCLATLGHGDEHLDQDLETAVTNAREMQRGSAPSAEGSAPPQDPPPPH